MKVLITGGSGFLGRYINQYFKDYNVFNLGRHENCKFKFDLKDKIDLLPFFDLVIHAAGKAHFKPINSLEENIFYQINVDGLRNLLDGLNSNPPKYFVFISSVSVYGLANGTNINEEFPLAATDSYGKSKVKAEMILQQWCNEKNVKCTIFRLPLIVGKSAPGNLGDLYKSIKKGYYFNVGKGKAKKSMVLASDIVKYIIPASKIGGIYNLTDGYHPSVGQLSQSISTKLGRNFIPNIPVFIARFISKFGDFLGLKIIPLNTDRLNKLISDLTFDDSLARENFDWDPNRVIDSL
jgi:nucleoside-diphosphate-sugar epimerase